jgi:parallel beta-helix repeat protein
MSLIGCGMPSSLPTDITGRAPSIGDELTLAPDTGAVRLQFQSDITTQATKAEVRQLRVSIAGGSLAAPMSQTVSYPAQTVTFKDLKEGAHTLTVEALDASAKAIGKASKGVDVVPGQLTSVAVNLKLDPTATTPTTGGVGVDVTIEDGELIPVPAPSPTPTPAPTQPPTSFSGYGVDPNYVPAYDVKVAPGQLTQALLDSKPTGTRFALDRGVHRLSGALKPKANQQLLGYSGAIISGAKTLSGWVQDGNRWYVTGQTQRLPESSAVGYQICEVDDPLCGKAEDVFYDNKPLKQVDALSKVTTGTFYFDYTNSRIYVGDNPSGHQVDTTVTTQAFNGGGTGVVLRNLVVEKFGNKAQTGAISNGGQSGWTVQNCDVRLNHGVGVFVGQNSKILGNKIHQQGQLGIAGNGSDILVEGNEIAYNNVGGYDAGWEAGGSKWVATTNLMVRKNWAHDNYGHGLWTDIDNRNTTFENNVAENNQRIGIIHEISFEATIRNNTVRGNGKGPIAWDVDGAGIVISNSSGVEAYGNTLENNVTGFVILHSPRGTWDTANNNVHDNTIRMSQGWSGLIRTDNTSTDHSLFNTKNNRFQNNTYIVPSTTGKYWDWMNSRRSWSEWRNYKQDTTGTVRT